MSISNQVLSSSAFLVAIRLIQRGIGLISILILARVLTPEDFGLIAIYATVLFFFEAISDLGAEQFIIRKDEVSEEDLNTAWSLNIITKFGLWLVMVLSAAPIAYFLDYDQLDKVLYVTSVILLINSLVNPELYLFKREFKYKLIFQLMAAAKLISFASVLAFLFIQPNYWALVVGNIVSAIVLVTGSFILFSFRPKFSLKNWKLQWDFSKWIMLRGLVGYSRAQIDILLVSKFFLIDQLGGYHLLRSLSVMPANEIIAPAIEPLLAAYSKIRDDRNELIHQVSVSITVVTVILLPIMVYVYNYPVEIINVLLGDKWINMHDIFSALSLAILAIVVGHVAGQLCLSLGMVKTLFKYDLLSLIILVMCLLYFSNYTLYEFTLARSMTAVLLVSSFLLFILRKANIPSIPILKVILPIVGISIIPVYLVNSIYVISTNIYLNLFISCVLYFALYVALLIVSYYIYYNHTKEGVFIYNLTVRLIKKVI